MHSHSSLIKSIDKKSIISICKKQNGDTKHNNQDKHVVKTSGLYNSDKSFVLRKHLFAYNRDIQKACWTYLTIALTGAESHTQLQNTTIPSGELLNSIRCRFKFSNRKFGFDTQKSRNSGYKTLTSNRIEF
jgi:hypothetical protein